jgi:hypothetical protein
MPAKAGIQNPITGECIWIQRFRRWRGTGAPGRDLIPVIIDEAENSEARSQKNSDLASLQQI